MVFPSKIPERISISSGSLRWVVYLFEPGFLKSNSAWISSLEIDKPGGQPSIIQPKASP